jgi:alkylhydroperoxidase/carboxymuconolactone decarboxylase family protein YurZ
MSQTGAASGQGKVTVSVLDRETTALVSLAVAIALGREELIAARSGEAVAAGVAPLWVDELLLQSVLMLGHPAGRGGGLAFGDRHFRRPPIRRPPNGGGV